MTPDPGDSRRSLILSGVLVVLILLAAYWLAGALFPFAISGVLAYLLLPLVKQLERLMPWRRGRPNLSRMIAVVVVFSLASVVVAVFFITLVSRLARESAAFLAQFPELFRAAQASIEEWNSSYAGRVPEDVRRRIEQGLAAAGDVLIDSFQGALLGLAGSISSTLSLVIGLATVPVFLFYLLKDQERISTGMYGHFPSSVRPHLQNVGSIINQTVGAYLQGQVLLGLVVGTLVMVGLSLLGVGFPVWLGIVAGVTELVPIIGPAIGGAAGVLVTLATAPEQVWWVLLLYLGIQVLENSLLVPRIQGSALNLHPIAVIIIIVIGSQLFGLWGVIFAPLLVSAARDVIRYFVVQWNRPATAATASPATSGAPGREGDGAAREGEGGGGPAAT